MQKAKARRAQGNPNGKPETECPCGSSVIMTHLNVSVKLSPYEEGDSFIEQQGTTTIDGPEPGTGRGVDR